MCKEFDFCVYTVYTTNTISFRFYSILLMVSALSAYRTTDSEGDHSQTKKKPISVSGSHHITLNDILLKINEEERGKEICQEQLQEVVIKFVFFLLKFNTSLFIQVALVWFYILFIYSRISEDITVRTCVPSSFSSVHILTSNN